MSLVMVQFIAKLTVTAAVLSDCPARERCVPHSKTPWLLLPVVYPTSHTATRSETGGEERKFQSEYDLIRDDLSCLPAARQCEGFLQGRQLDRRRAPSMAIGL
jgi:hypothetical protein